MAENSESQKSLGNSTTTIDNALQTARDLGMKLVGTGGFVGMLGGFFLAAGGRMEGIPVALLGLGAGLASARYNDERSREKFENFAKNLRRNLDHS